MIYDRLLTLELLGIVLREIAALGRNAPLKAALIGLHLFGEYLEQCGRSLRICAYERDLVLTSDHKADIVEYLNSVNSLGEVLDCQDLIADGTVGSEIDIRIYAARRSDIVELDLLEGTLTRGSLL